MEPVSAAEHVYAEIRSTGHAVVGSGGRGETEIGVLDTQAHAQRDSARQREDAKAATEKNSGEARGS